MESRQPLVHPGPVRLFLEDNLDSVGVAAFLVDPDGRVLAWNREMARLADRAAKDVVGWSLDDLVAARVLPAVDKLVTAAATGSPPGPERLLFSWTTPAVQRVAARFTARPVVDEQGRTAGVLVTAVEALETARLRAEVDELKAELGSQAASPGGETGKEAFLAMLAHELRNPLAAILTAVHVIRRHAAADFAVGHASQVIERQVHHLARLLDDLRDLSRIGVGRMELRPQPVSLEAAAAEAVEVVQPLFRAGRHQFFVSGPEAPVLVEADTTRLVQIIGNLLQNAAKYTSPGGRIELTMASERDEGVVTVRDTGLGIEPEMLPRVFDLFAQAPGARSRALGGLGIGLSLVRRLVELHGGRVEAHSQGLGCGSEFIVRLPLARGPASPPAASPARPAPGRRLRILVAEDSRDAQAMLRAALELEGHAVLTASSGSEALAVAQAGSPDAVLLDLALPGGSGYEIVRALREKFGNRIVLVALTGYGDPETHREVLAAGCDAHLVKPVDPGSVLRALEERRRL